MQREWRNRQCAVLYDPVRIGLTYRARDTWRTAAYPHLRRRPGRGWFAGRSTTNFLLPFDRRGERRGQGTPERVGCTTRARGASAGSAISTARRHHVDGCDPRCCRRSIARGAGAGPLAARAAENARTIGTRSHAGERGIVVPCASPPRRSLAASREGSHELQFTSRLASATTDQGRAADCPGSYRPS